MPVTNVEYILFESDSIMSTADEYECSQRASVSKKSHAGLSAISAPIATWFRMDWPVLPPLKKQAANILAS
jgi:hypothetical protein